ncbi:MAG: hypothetical protein PHX62_04725 [Bacilli bacterium]|nr:hypothetical protein [Bacilli bacterium]
MSVKQAQLLFLSNNLLSPKLQKKLSLPLVFISFGHMKGSMYKHFRNQNVFVLPQITKGNSVVYGAIFLCNYFDFYSKIIDAFFSCSKSTLLRNHQNDLHHRINCDITPIYFSTLNELQRLKYKESNTIHSQIQTYIGNTHHPKIKNRINKLFYIVSGIDAENFKLLFKEMKHD